MEIGEREMILDAVERAGFSCSSAFEFIERRDWIEFLDTLDREGYKIVRKDP